MTRLLLSIFFFIAIGFAAEAQDSIQYRVIFIGDAGEINPLQKNIIGLASNQIIAGKTSVVYLGDNIYPRGMGLPGSPEEATTKEILRSQFVPMRSKAAPVYFVPGNHDWDRSGPLGLAKIIAQSQFLKQQNDTSLRMVPANGCPDPVEIKLAPNLTLIAWDSEWWLYPFIKENSDTGCACKTKKDVVAKLEELRNRNKDRMILLASHHPFKTYGEHGGHFTFKDHLFPLTAFNKNLYIPLPVIGSLYPVLRNLASHPEDIKHPLYKDMISSVSSVFEGFPNIAYVAGHEHGLQLITDDDRLQVVSGAGAKHTNAKMGKGSLFADATQGFVTADLLADNSLRFNFYIHKNDTAQLAFTYQQPYTKMLGENETTEPAIATDSVTVSIRPGYNKKGRFHRLLFGENYRKEWAGLTTLPVIKISQLHGGLKPLQLGGGMQSKSLRLEDAAGKEWVMRSVEKSVDAILPEGLRRSFAKDWLDDVTSAQHPYAALVVPTIAQAVKVPHSNPVIGVVSPDKNLGAYGKTFNHMIVLLEEREPLGESDNSEKLKENLQKDNDNTVEGKEVLRARMLDAYLGDWDRHEDQWRWFDNDKGKEKKYLAVPRDRDQVFHLTQGLLPSLAAQQTLVPTLRHFDGNMSQVKWLLFKTRFVNAYPGFQLSREEWKQQAEKFAAAIPDSVLETALRHLPKTAYDLRHDVLLKKMQARREILPDVMDRYYRFTQKVADITTSDKNEYVEITDGADGGLNLRINKLNKEGQIKDELMNKTYDAALTREIRLYIGNGKDSVVINTSQSGIRLRIIGGKDSKVYNVIASKHHIPLYDRSNASVFIGDSGAIKKHISDDSLNTAFAPVNLYSIFTQNFILGMNLDDGFILGSGFTYIKQEGFRRTPFASRHYFYGTYSFSTGAYQFGYNSEWTKAAGKADITLTLLAKAPENTTNFFGRGNETFLDRHGDYVRHYRTRFSTYQADAALRWNGKKGPYLIFGPSLYYYLFDSDDNKGRFINNKQSIGSYDSATISKDKLHLGFTAQFTSDRRNSKIIPQWGTYLNVRVQAYKGMGSFARDFAQLVPELALYKSLDAQSNIVLAERIGGTVTLGKAAFYQSAFIGGHENLLGYRQYRFAGQHSFYNNLELRIKIADIASYILPGQFGITGFWDIGRVWENNDNSGKWHNGTGAGIYFAPASLVAFNLVMGHSKEGWLPYFTMGFRF
ncbi:MAG: BamA/TamA family outer membrane protein [Bacteroidota bacterium]